MNCVKKSNETVARFGTSERPRCLAFAFPLIIGVFALLALISLRQTVLSLFLLPPAAHHAE